MKKENYRKALKVRNCFSCCRLVWRDDRRTNDRGMCGTFHLQFHLNYPTIAFSSSRIKLDFFPSHYRLMKVAPTEKILKCYTPTASDSKSTNSHLNVLNRENWKSNRNEPMLLSALHRSSTLLCKRSNAALKSGHYFTPSHPMCLR